MGVNSGLYNLVLFLHLVAVIVGIGGVALNGVYAARIKAEGGAAGAAIARANAHVSWGWAEKFIYAIPVFGILLVLLSDGEFEFSELWISLSFLLYIVAVGLAHGFMRPAERRLEQLGGELAALESPGTGGRPAQVTEMDALEKKMAAMGMVLNLLAAAILALMIWKPGA